MNSLDRFISFFSPSTAYRRQLFRDALKKRETYAAAKTTRLTGNWTTTSTADVNNVISLSSPAVRARVRQLLRDFPYLARAAKILVDYSVGTGIIYQSKVKGSDGKLDKKVNTRIEDAVKWWMDEADAAGKLHYYEMMRLAKRQDCESGEFLLVKAMQKDPNRYVPYALQMYEVDWLTSRQDTYGLYGLARSTDSTKEVRQGIEYDNQTGRVTGYYFADPTYGGDVTYIPAQQVVHGFQTYRPGQLRGISDFAPGVILANDLAEYMDAEIDGAKMAAKWVAFVKTKTPQALQSGLPYSQVTAGGDTQEKIEELANGIIEYLRPDEDIELASANRPGQTFQPFVRLLLTMLAVTTGVPFELISGEYTGLNFSTAKIVRNDFAQQLRPISMQHIRQFGMPTIGPAIDYAVMSGKLYLPNYWKNRRRYLEGEWQPPGMDAVDPLREAKSQIEAISFGLKSRQQVARERGVDLEDIYKDQRADLDMQEEYGLNLTAAKTNAANNPAAVNKEGD